MSKDMEVRVLSSALLSLRKAFREHLGNPIQRIGVAEIKEVFKATRTRQTRAKWLSAMNQLFSYASAEGINYISFNPAGAIVRPPRYRPNRSGDAQREEVEVLNPDEVTKLLRFVERMPSCHCMVMPLCMQLFLGLRRVEVGLPTHSRTPRLSARSASQSS